MKKKLIALLLSTAMVLSAVACSAGTTDTTDTTDTASTTETDDTADAADTEDVVLEEDTITIMVPPVTGDYVELLDGWIEDFTAEYPHLTIEVIETSWDEHTSKLTTMALAGEAPDIAEVSYTTISTLVEMGVTVDITDYMTEERLSDYDDNALDYMTVEDTLYGLPLYITIQALGGNLEMLEAAGADVEKIQTEGWTWDEFLEIVAAGTTDDTYGFIFANSGVTSADYITVFGTSVGLTNAFTDELLYAYTSENMLTLLESVEELIGGGYMPDYGIEAAVRLVMLETGEAMVTGKAMPLFESSVNTNNAGIEDGTAAENSIEVEYVFLPTPTVDGASDAVYGSVDGFVALKNNNTTDEHLENVLLFMDYICSGERAASLYEALYLTPVTESGREAAAELELDQSDLNAAATERAISLVVAPPTGVSAEASSDATTLMDEIIIPKFQSLIAGEITAEEMYEVICDEAFALLGEENCETGWID